MSFMMSTGNNGKLTFDDTPGKKFVTSGTGFIGYRVAMSLLEAGYTHVRVGVWKADRQAGDEDLAGKCTYNLRSAPEIYENPRTTPLLTFETYCIPLFHISYDAALNGVKMLYTIPHIAK
jgi:hypothetical protein